jgi:hypothetical protein
MIRRLPQFVSTSFQGKSKISDGDSGQSSNQNTVGTKQIKGLQNESDKYLVAGAILSAAGRITYRRLFGKSK